MTVRTRSFYPKGPPNISKGSIVAIVDPQEHLLSGVHEGTSHQICLLSNGPASPERRDVTEGDVAGVVLWRTWCV